MAFPEWKAAIIGIGVVLLLLHEAVWQWRWWGLDDTGYRGYRFTPCLPGNHILVSNDSSKFTCQPCRVCNAGMELLPPCGSVLTFNTVVKCTSILTKVLQESKQRTSTKPERKKNAYLDRKGANNIITQNENFVAWPSLDVDDIYDTEELEDTNLSERAGYKETFSFPRSTQDVQGKITTPPTKYSLPKAMRRWRQRRVNPKFPTNKRFVPRPIPPPSIEANTQWSGQFTAHPPVPEQMNKISPNITAASPQNININCVLGGFLGTVLAWLLFSLIRTIAWNKKLQGYRLIGTEQPEREVEEMSDVNEDVDYTFTTDDLKYLKLSEIPADLENLLVKKLDVRRGRLYGWQRVGAAFKIDKDDLEYLKIEYKRENGSPTSTLLSILGISKSKTVSDLMNVLKSPKVKLADVASLVRRYIKAANKSQ